MKFARHAVPVLAAVLLAGVVPATTVQAQGQRGLVPAQQGQRGLNPQSPNGRGDVSTSIPLALIKRYDASVPRGGASAGSCALVARSTTKAYWLTAEHVIDGPRGYVTIQRPGKQTLEGKVIAVRHAPDLALIRTSSASVTKYPFPIWPYQITDRDYWAEGYASATFNDFGRRKGRLLGKSSNSTRWSFPSIPGESGGCVYTLHGNTKYLCGVVSASDWPRNPRGLLGGFTVGGDARAIRDFLNSAGLPVGKDGYVSTVAYEQKNEIAYADYPTGIFRRALGGRRHQDPCPDCYPKEQPQINNPQNIIPEDYIRPDPPPQQPPEQLPQPTVDYEKIRAMIKQEMALIAPQDGRDGRDGKDGKDGVTADELKPLIANAVRNAVGGMPRGVTEDRVREIMSEVPPGLTTADVEQIIDSRLEPFAKQIVESILDVETPIQLDRGNGDIESLGTFKLGTAIIIPRKAGMAAISHMVVVATSTERLVREFDAAKESFSELIMVPQSQVPDNVIVRRYPALVAYASDGTVAGLWDGSRDVSEKLQQIARGLFP